jgi:DNA processing protein
MSGIFSDSCRWRRGRFVIMGGVATSPTDSRVAEWLDEPGHALLHLGDDNYPELLARISNPPESLYIIGDPALLHVPSLAIVGSRNPSSGGARNAFEFARFLGRSGFCIVSGLAQGIDSAAHKGALAAGASTIAFLGHGIDTIYPAQNRELAAQIARQGALVSEFPLGTAPMKELFPQRNRLISGIALGTLVVEAARRSGSLITARLASEQGREVFAIPGSIHNAMARGCHRLIRDGAKLVESADDILSELAPLMGHVLDADRQPTSSTSPTRVNDPEYVKLLESLGHDPISVDELVAHSGLTIGQLSSMLLILELDEMVEKLSGGRYVLLS